MPLPDGWYGAGLVDVDVDPTSGAPAVAYFDRGDGSVWLGGCSAACPDGPVMSLVYSSAIVPPVEMPQPSIEVAASAGGPWPS